jgi:cell division protein FtsA
VEKSGLHIHDLVLQPLASAAAVMCDLDFEAGVAIVDIGGGTTDLAVFYEGILKHTAVIPYGGENITNDIKNGLGVLKTQAEQMKVQFGYALADEAKSNAYITIPGLRGQNPKEISVKNLAHIIQARMSEILDFVVYHLKQIGMDNKMLNGGIILTGGGSQLKHLIQLTEYTTGVNARIGYPNEHLASGHIDELTKPMYATCVGLILKGYNDYENDRRSLEENYVKINTSFTAKEKASGKAADVEDDWMQETAADAAAIQEQKARERNASLKNFLDRMKTKIIDMFTEEEDAKL